MKKSGQVLGVIIIIGLVLVVLASFFSAYNEIHSDTTSIGAVVPDFRLQSVDGKIVHLQEIHAEHIILLFFDPSCPNCRNEIETINHIISSKPNIVVLGIMKKTESQLLYLTNPHFPILISEEEVFEKYEIHFVPSLLILDKEKRVKFKLIGFRESIDKELINGTK